MTSKLTGEGAAAADDDDDVKKNIAIFGNEQRLRHENKRCSACQEREKE